MAKDGLSSLYNRLSRAIEANRGMQFSSEDVDWFVISGAYGKLVQASVDELFRICRARLEAKGEDLSWLDTPAPPEVVDEYAVWKAERERLKKK